MIRFFYDRLVPSQGRSLYAITPSRFEFQHGCATLGVAFLFLALVLAVVPVNARPQAEYVPPVVLTSDR